MIAAAAKPRAVHAPEAMCEAYDYPAPSAFSRGFEVHLGTARLVVVSGTASVGADGATLHVGDFRAQARRMYANATAVLRSAGASWRHVVKATIFLADIEADYAAFNEERCAFFRAAELERYPASTCVQARLCRPELLVEMELWAVVPAAAEVA